MAQFLEFFSNHAILFGCFFGLLVLYIQLETKRSGKKISPNMLGTLSQEGARLIDLRDPKDFKAGRIAGSENIPYAKLKEHTEELKNSDKPLVFICNIGHMASAANAAVGNPNSYRLEGGIQGWRSAGLPMIQG